MNRNPYNWRLILWMTAVLNPITVAVYSVIAAVQDFAPKAHGWYCAREPGHSGPCEARYR